jgi:hypothetical protein
MKTPEEMNVVVVQLVNFNARVMDYCVSAAQSIVREKLVEHSAIVHGNDEGPSEGNHPMTGPLAIALFNEVTSALKEGARRMQGDGEREKQTQGAGTTGE